MNMRPRRDGLPRRGEVITVWDSTGHPTAARVLHVNRHWIDLIDDKGERTWVATRHYVSKRGTVPVNVIMHGMGYPHHHRRVKHVGEFLKIECQCGRSWMIDAS